jgi:hypothetical protein
MNTYAFIRGARWLLEGCITFIAGEVVLFCL